MSAPALARLRTTTALVAFALVPFLAAPSRADPAGAPARPHSLTAADRTLVPAGEALARAPSTPSMTRVATLLDTPGSGTTRRREGVAFEPSFAIEAPSKRPRHDAAERARLRPTGGAAAPNTPAASAASGDEPPAQAPERPSASGGSRAVVEETRPSGLRVPNRSPLRPAPDAVADSTPQSADVRVDAKNDGATLPDATSDLPRDVPRRHPKRPMVAGPSPVDTSEARRSAAKAAPAAQHSATPPDADERAASAPVASVAAVERALPQDGARASAATGDGSPTADARTSPDEEPALPDAGEPPIGGPTSPDPTAATVPADRDAGEAQADGADEASTQGPSRAKPPSVGEGAAAGPQPYRLVRMLTALEDEIAQGSSAALSARRVLSRRLGEHFRTAPSAAWSEPANARALVIYTLSGGDPRVTRAVLSGLDEAGEPLASPVLKSLADGALAYTEGRQEDALRHFAGVGPQNVPHSLRGPVLMARAALAVGDDPSAARALLDEARLAAPGTLVEEAALRRAILIAAAADDTEGFAVLVERYLRRFRRSIYAGNFRERLAAALTRMRFIEDPAAFETLARLFAPLTTASRQDLYLLIARAAVENGSPEAARRAAQIAKDTAPAGTLDHRRARLYRAAAMAVAPEGVADALAELDALRALELPPEDRALLNAASELARAVATLPEPALALAGHSALPGEPGNGPIGRQTIPDEAVADRNTASDNDAALRRGPRGRSAAEAPASDGTGSGPRASDGAGAAQPLDGANAAQDASSTTDSPAPPTSQVERRADRLIVEIDALLEAAQ